MVNFRENILSVMELESTEKVFAKLNKDGFAFESKLQLKEILNIFRNSYGAYLIRGNVYKTGVYDVSFEEDYVTYEPLNETIIIGKHSFSYANASFSVYVSHSDWVDLFINYDEKSTCKLTFVPKNNK